MAKIEIGDFRDGLNTRDKSHEVGQFQSPAMQNVDVVSRGTVKTRSGFYRISESIISGATQDYGAGYIKLKHLRTNLGNIYWHDPESSSGHSGGWTILSSGWAASANMYYEEWDNYGWFANGVQAPQKWDGASFSAITSGAAGWGSGTYPDMIVEHEERLWGFDFSDSRLDWSNSGDGDQWTGVDDSGSQTISPNDGSPGTGIISRKGGLVIFKYNSITVCRGKTPLSFTFERIYKTIGSIATRSIVNIGGDIYFLGRYGEDYAVYKLDAADRIEVVSNVIAPSFWRGTGISSGYTEAAAAVEKDGRYTLSYPYMSGESVNDAVKNYNLTTGVWENDFGNAMQMYYRDSILGLIYGADPNGGIHCFSRFYTSDNGYAITSYVETRNYLFEGADADKELNVLVVWVKASGNWDMNVNLYIDDKLEKQTYKVSLGTKETSETTRRYVIKLNHKCTGNMIRFKFGTSTVNQPFELYKAILYYDIKQPAISN